RWRRRPRPPWNPGSGRCRGPRTRSTRGSARGSGSRAWPRGRRCSRSCDRRPLRRFPSWYVSSPTSARGRREETMATGFEIGIEEEYQLVDPDTGALLGQAPRVLEGGARTPFKPELQTTMVEVDTAVSLDVAEAIHRLAARRGEAIRQAREQGIALVAAGLHPVGIYPPDRITDTPHYRGVAANGGRVGRELHIFGLHVHVAVPDRESAIRAMCGATPYIPHLIALSASSPLYQGRDTGFASFRTLLRDMFPEVGPPFPVASAAEYERLVAILRGSRFEPGRSSPISWDIRPSPRYPTLEFRFFDACPRLADVAVLAAFARGVTAMFADRPPPQPTGTELHVPREDRWPAAR